MTDLLRPTFRVPATRGRMGSTEYFTATLPFGAVTKLFTFDPADMLEMEPENRSQRLLKTKRIPEIAKYILDHDDFIFSSITVSVDSEHVEFHEAAEGADIGELVLPLEAKYVINDGQHRVAGIVEALRSDPRLAEDTISVVMLPDGGLERSQQIFSDLNRTVHKTSKSLDILYDHRLPVHRITMACTEQVPLFRGRIDKERVSLSPRSVNFATLSGLQQANVNLLGDQSESLAPDEERTLQQTTVEYWTRLTELVRPWRAILDGTVKPPEARQRYVSSYALSLWALGAVGRAARDRGGTLGTDWRETLAGLARIDWLKTNPDWQGICMIGTEIVTRQPTRRATAEYIMWKIGLAPHAPTAPLEADGQMSRNPTRTTPRTQLPPGLAAMHRGLEPDPRIDRSPQEERQRRSTPAKPPKAATQPGGADPTGRRPTAIVLFGERFPIRTNNDGLAKLVEVLLDRDPEVFPRLLEIRGRTRHYLSRDPEQLHTARPVGMSEYFVEANLSAVTTWKTAKRFLCHLGHNESDLDVRYD